MEKYRKALVALAGALAQLISLGVLDGDAQTAATCLLAALTAIGVYGVRNEPDTALYSDADADVHLR